MTNNLSDRTNVTWQSVPARFRRLELDRPLFPRPTTMPPFEHIPLHAHPFGQLAYISQGVLTMVTEQGTFVIPPNKLCGSRLKSLTKVIAATVVHFGAFTLI
ncbi:hypothetical protein NI389_10520 [Pseudoalteromonas xiamenensis]|uniref:hypothetical protein n=1 Tax=Pseudoalteromonas xiamenensis TaxID=882626 RepID=UPI0027E52DDA|nr:hypothetical protein [Pseudoalteromonas xiamenensis]WMN58681.1 hypothetical protein NI389_10520 [Pseudoalteromonas xiamenensis]